MFQAFDSRAELQVHNQVHMRDAKPYKCSHCPKTFANSSYLSQHMRIHLGVKPFGPCQFCSRKVSFVKSCRLVKNFRFSIFFCEKLSSCKKISFFDFSMKSFRLVKSFRFWIFCEKLSLLRRFGACLYSEIHA